MLFISLQILVCKLWKLVRKMCYLLLDQNKLHKTEKRSPRNVLLKRCSANPQQIYNRASMEKCYATFSEITTAYGSPPVNLLHICMTHLWREAIGDYFWVHCQYCLQMKMNKLDITKVSLITCWSAVYQNLVCKL